MGRESTEQSLSAELRAVWTEQEHRLHLKAKANAGGELASASGRISLFLSFLASEAGATMQARWLAWRTRRDAIRKDMFGRSQLASRLRELYEDGRQRSSVLLGGPPCQGFSRIGRGKIRSLRENGVHVQESRETGDERNLLLESYVLFVAALAPDSFPVQNVRHFQTKVRTEEGVFLATEVLAEAIRDLSANQLGYQVASRIIDASLHLIPQARERFFMVGLRDDRAIRTESGRADP